MSKHMAIIGTGAIGAQVGGRLSMAGADITLIDGWKENVEAMRQKGLTLEDESSTQFCRVHALHTDEVDRLEEKGFDVLFVSVKSYDTERVVRLMLPYLKDDAWVVSIQNSINEEIIAPIVGWKRVMGCVCLSNGQMWEPAHPILVRSISHTAVSNVPGFIVGELRGPATERVRELAAILEGALPTNVTDDLLRERWTKLTTNCMVNSVAGATGMGSSQLMSNAESQRVLVRIAAEVLRVAEAEGHPVQKVLGDFTPEQIFAAANGKDTTVFEALAERSKRVSPRGMSSLLQDVTKGRKTEIDYLNGLVARKGKARGIPTPVNERLVEMVHAVEAGAMRPSPEALAQVRELL